MKVLVVEDDADISNLLTYYFEAKGHDVVIARDGLDALRQFKEAQPELILLDVMLPKLDGWAVLEAVRAQSSVPVIMLTALGDTEDVVTGLSLGADDYLRKPFEIRELEARISSIQRRVVQAAPDLMQCGHITIDDRSKSVAIDGNDIPLSPKEYEMLKLLASDPGRVFTNAEIIDHVWEGQGRATSVDVKQCIYHLRNRIEQNPQAPQLIQNVKGFGYKLVV
ncbi:MAG: response regulator transcription factor [Pseudomonadota bacterium]